jgi:hypothetical protein
MRIQKIKQLNLYILYWFLCLFGPFGSLCHYLYRLSCDMSYICETKVLPFCIPQWDIYALPSALNEFLIVTALLNSFLLIYPVLFSFALNFYQLKNKFLYKASSFSLFFML